MDPEEQGQESAQNVEQAGNTAKRGVQKVGNKAKQAKNKAKNAIKKARDRKKKADKAKAAGKAAGKTGKSLSAALKAIAPAIPYILIGIAIIIAAVLIAFGLVALINYIYKLVGGTYENGEFSTHFGVKGDSFYGERFLYYDTSFSAKEIADNYKEMTYEVLMDLQNANKINANLSLGDDYKTDTATISIATNLAKEVSSFSEDGQNITYYTMQIDHYGLNADERGKFIDVLNNYLEGKGYNSATNKEIADAVEDMFDAELSYMKNVCSKVIVKDYLYESKDDGLSGVRSKNYIGMVFMPREDITIKDTSIAFVVGQNVTVDASVNYVESGEVTNIASAQVDDTWFQFQDNLCEKFLDAELKQYPVKEFTAFDDNKNYLSEEKSIFTLLKKDIFNKYFNATTDYSAENLIKSIKADNYIYVGCQSDSVFILGDTITDY